MSLLCYDLSSGGITAALFDSALEPLQLIETHWEPAPTLNLDSVTSQFLQITRQVRATDPITAISVGTFLHSFVLIDREGKPLTNVSTWLDSRGDDGVRHVQSRLGDAFHARTGCRYHPMFPVFKLASMHLSGDKLLAQAARVVSIKSFFVHMLTGMWVEDDGTACATGLFDVTKGAWDPEILNLVGISENQLPPVQSRTALVGHTTEGVPVVNGSGDGFLANIGSDCETAERIAVTLGTSGVARQTVAHPVLNPSSGTFCYRAADGVFLLGCAGNNGGNVLDWGRSIFGSLDGSGDDIPIFIPLLNGERSPEWNPTVTGSWHGLKAKHTASDLSRSILEGVIFNLAYFVEIVQNTSGRNVADIVLSGNGFRDPLAAPILAAVVDAAVWMPEQTGLASLRGSAICALRAMGLNAPPIQATTVEPLKNTNVRERYQRYKSFRLQKLPS